MCPITLTARDCPAPHLLCCTRAMAAVESEWIETWLNIRLHRRMALTPSSIAATSPSKAVLYDSDRETPIRSLFLHHSSLSESNHNRWILDENHPYISASDLDLFPGYFGEFQASP
jgi:hypothetical protein